MKSLFSHFFCRCLLVAAMTGCCLPSVASGAKGKYPALKMHGISYPNACSVDEKLDLQKMLLEMKIKDASEVWYAINVLLCGPRNDVARRTIKRLLPNEVRQDFSSTGDEPSFEMVKRSDELVERLIGTGEAWDVTVREESGKIVLQYFSNEACVREVTLEYVRSTWLIHGLGEACD